jgi:nitrite reductase (NO-forming)
VEVAPGVRQQVWTYNGTVPGPVLHGRVGDLFTVRVVNGGSMPHSIDFHASQVAPDEAMRDIPPGGELTYQFRAEHAGAWLYHCATAPMIQHLAMGMYGAVVIDPPTLDPVAVSEVFVQSEFYLGAKGGVPDMSRLLSANPDLVVFNGYADQYRHAPLHVPAGKRIRVWVVDAGPSGPSAFHVVGAQFDTVFKEGAYQLRPGNAAHGAAQELDLQPGEGGFVEFVLPKPGTYPFTTHRLADAQRGAMGTFVASP